MATILAATSTARRKGLKPSLIVGRQVTDRVEKVRKEATIEEALGKPHLDKGKGKVEEVPKRRQSFSTNRVGGSAANPPMPRSEAPVGEKLMATSIAIVREEQKRAFEVDPPHSSKKG